MWSRLLPHRLLGLRLAREAGSLLAWDDASWLRLLGPTGVPQGSVQIAEPIADAVISEDGTALAVAGRDGMLRWLGPDLSVKWERRLKPVPQVLAMQALGGLLAVSDVQGGILLLDDCGTEVGKIQASRPLRHLAIVPEKPQLIGCADFGLLGGFDRTGQWQWRDAPVVNAGALAVAGDGSLLVLACFSEGLICYGPHGKKLASLALPQPCGNVALSYSGDKMLAGALQNSVYVLDRSGRILAEFSGGKSLAGLALSAAGDRAYLAYRDGEIACYKLLR